MIRRIVLALVVVLLLAGCQDDPEPKIAAPSETPVSTSPSASEAVESETAEAFIERWIRAEDDMQSSGATDSYRAITSGCQTCQEFADQVQGYYAAGGYVRPGEQEIQSIRQLPTTGSTAVFRVRILAKRTSYKRAANSQVESFPGGPITYKVSLESAGSSWTLIEYFREST